jgi:hypothetical protein
MPTTYDLLGAANLLLATSADMTADEFDARLAAFIDESADKMAALRAVAKAAAATEAMHKDEAAGHAARAKSAGARADRAKERAYVLLCAKRELGEEPKVPGVARIQANGGKAPIVLLDADAIPDHLVVVERHPNAAAIRAALERGEDVPGCALGERGEGVRWE